MQPFPAAVNLPSPVLQCSGVDLLVCLSHVLERLGRRFSGVYLGAVWDLQKKKRFWCRFIAFACSSSVFTAKCRALCSFTNRARSRLASANFSFFGPQNRFLVPLHAKRDCFGFLQPWMQPSFTVDFRSVTLSRILSATEKTFSRMQPSTASVTIPSHSLAASGENRRRRTQRDRHFLVKMGKSMA